MNARLRTYLEFSVWIVLGIILAVPKKWDESTTVHVMLYILCGVIWALAIDSIVKLVVHITNIRKGLYADYKNDSRVKNLSHIMFMKGMAYMITRDRNAGPLTSEELDEAFHKDWDAIMNHKEDSEIPKDDLHKWEQYVDSQIKKL